MTCPNCDRPIDPRALVCPHCRALVWAQYLVIIGDYAAAGDIALDVDAALRRERVAQK